MTGRSKEVREFGLKFTRYLRSGMDRHPPSERLKADFDQVTSVRKWHAMLEHEINLLRAEGRLKGKPK